MVLLAFVEDIKDRITSKSLRDMSINQRHLQDLCGRLVTATNNLSSLEEDKIDPEVRQEIIHVCRQIFDHAILPKEEWIERLGMVCIMSATVLYIKWGVFDAIPLDGQISFRELAEKVKADPNLIRRIGGVLVGSNVLQQVSTDHVAHTARSLVYLETNPYCYLIEMAWDSILKSCAFLPEYFAWCNRTEPQGTTGCSYSYAFGKPETSMWDIMHEDPRRMQAFMQAMDTVETFMPPTAEYDLRWVQELMFQDKDRVLFVDVGGGKGHIVRALCDKNEWLPRDRCVVQDREEVVQNASVLDNPGLKGVNFMAHDFRHAQPIRGALVYHLRRCLHDYGDEVCIQILRRISDAMAPDSRLLLVESILSAPPLLVDAQFDFNMMTLGGKERSATEFKHIVGEAGLKILDIQKGPQAPIAVIECIKV